jgi:hypothetical protein
MADVLDEIEDYFQTAPAPVATPVVTPVATPTETSWWDRITSPTSPLGLAYDIGGGVARAGAALGDFVAMPIELGYRVQNKLLDALQPYNPLDPRNLFASDAETLALLEAQRLKDQARPIAPFSTETAQALQSGAEYFGLPVSPERQELISAVIPISAGSKAKMAAEAGLGLMSYAGGELGEAVTDSPAGALVGALTPVGVLGLAKAGARKLSEPLGRLAGSEKALQETVQQEIMSRLTPDDIARIEFAQQFPKTAVTGLGAQKTLAEITGSPAIAQYQQSAMANTAASRPLIDAMKARSEAIETAIEEIGIPTQQGELSVALKSAAEQAEKRKSAAIGSLSEGLGLTSDVKELTKLEKGEGLISSLQARADKDYTPVQQAWKNVDKTAKLDVSEQLFDVADIASQYGELTKKQITELGKDVVEKAERLFLEQNGIISVDDYQDMLGTVNFLLRETKQKLGDTEKGLLVKLKNSLLDIEPTGINVASEAHKKAIAATREYRQKYSSGVVGALLQERGGQLVSKASRAVQTALKDPENAREIVEKFGRNSTEALTIRTELMAQLDAAKNPSEFIARNKDLFNIFEGDLSQVRAYAKAKETGTGLEKFANVVDATVPNRIFENEIVANQFAKQFKGTEIELMARRKFADRIVSQRGSAVENLAKQDNIARAILGPDYDKFKTIVSDIEQLKVPGKLETIATGKQSVTSTRERNFSRLMKDRAFLEYLSKRGSQIGLGVGGAIGYGAGSGAGPLVGGITGAVGSVAGGVAGERVGKIAQIRLDDLTRIAAEITANPKLLKLATGPASDDAVTALRKSIEGLLPYGSKALGRQETPDTAMPVQPSDIDILSEIEASTGSLEAIPTETEPPAEEVELPTITIGKQDVSIPVGEKYAPADLVKAVIQVESGGKSKAVSSKGATGLMQLMPGTAKELGVDPRDPQENIEGGSRYLAKQLEAFGSPELALAAYNWGPGNVRSAVRRIKQQGLEPTWDNIIETLRVPAETRNYVRKVLSLYA